MTPQQMTDLVCDVITISRDELLEEGKLLTIKYPTVAIAVSIYIESVLKAGIPICPDFLRGIILAVRALDLENTEKECKELEKMMEDSK